MRRVWGCFTAWLNFRQKSSIFHKYVNNNIKYRIKPKYIIYHVLSLLMPFYGNKDAILKIDANIRIMLRLL